MNQKEKIKKYRESIQVEASEEKIQETICKSKNAFFMAEQERMLSYHDFLWTQLRVIQKRWWVLQFMILVALWIALSSIHDEIYLKRSMGVVATLFVILIIPELWKNRSCECMEIEAASYLFIKTGICYTYAVIWYYRYFFHNCIFRSRFSRFAL